MPSRSAKPNNPDDPLSTEAAARFQAALLAWFRRKARDYPWRRTEDPYAILVSEVMLQQTQIATVLGRGYYDRWMAQFPDVAALARAEVTDILKAWEGLGYYSRARNLQRTAHAIMERHGGRFPDTLEEILALPGVGRYTAGAVLSFAWNRPAPIVDGNIARVYARLFRLEEEVNAPAGQRRLWDLAEALTHPREPRDANSAIMELGQRVCLPRQPRCVECPVQVFCQSAGRTPEDYPRKKPARETVFLNEHVLWAVQDGKLLLQQESGRRRTGLWRLPERKESEVSDPPLELLHRLTCAITHHRISLAIYRALAAEARDGESWHPLTSLAALAMPGPFRRAVDALLARGEGRD
jgi:A/G-specific adenine glycosylase